MNNNMLKDSINSVNSIDSINSIDNKNEENSEIYLSKYVKYKIKYSQLKNFKNKQKGGAIPYFYERNEIIKRINLLEDNKKKEKSLHQYSRIYLKANVVNKKIIKNYNKIRKIILKNDSPPPFSYHLTLLIFDINLDYPVIGDLISYMDTTTGRKKIKKDLSFLNEEIVKLNFQNIFKNMVMKTIDHEVLGKLLKIRTKSLKEIGIGVKNPESLDCLQYPGNYFVDKFEVNNKNLIINFRTKFYEGLNEFVKEEFIKRGGKEKDFVSWRADSEIDPEYILIYYDNFSRDIPLLAIHKFYYGKHTWVPHISIFNMEELENNNFKFLSKYAINFLTWQNKKYSDKLLFDELNKSKTIKNAMKTNTEKQVVIEDLEFILQI